MRWTFRKTPYLRTFLLEYCNQTRRAGRSPVCLIPNVSTKVYAGGRSPVFLQQPIFKLFEYKIILPAHIFLS
ncbi:MAG: hypothetical protein FWG68_01675 [Defluviitaleaceae bacterium]|nr:hypothetical protein [Defluviitaleaceae bacterium]